MQVRIKEHDRDIQLTGTETSATHRVKEATHTRLHPNNIDRDSGIEIPEAWMPTIKKHNNRRAL
ncbi:hypothetical protein pdam_00007040 [Pocillopora damicornis]|uniref:Uncharacterized protein n=1 Tax=Pocillopora damicornis TaxID=46731 RepID=A0A3M6T999_POCDA|nr:hypothetical protein pdam_00007040 [Pocillopora damicornis]